MHFSTIASGILLGLPMVFANLEPLHTSSRWIMDSNNKRFKLKCINWAGHMEAHIPEGLQYQSIENITQIISDSGFNCVRLTFSIDMALSQDVKVAQTWSGLASATGADAGQINDLWKNVVEKNPWIEEASSGDVFGRVADVLGTKGIRVIYDNHVSKAQWCCNLDDGNGWWDQGTPYFQNNQRNFNTENWKLGLAAMAQLASGHPAVAGIGLRNEIRETPIVQNRGDWYNFISQGAHSVHDANPDLLIVMGGTLSSTDASFLRSNPLDRSPFGDKVVWEWHQYTFSPPWIASFKNCNIWKGVVGGFTGFLLRQDKPFTGPLWLSEFGFDMSPGPAERKGVNNADDYKYISCLIDYATGNDGDWALWAIQGSYYVRDSQVNREESWGLLNKEWTAWRNPMLKDLFAPLFLETQGP